MIIIINILLIIIIFLLWKKTVMIYKISYYEQTLKNNKHLFSDVRFKQIEKIMNTKNPFK